MDVSFDREKDQELQRRRGKGFADIVALLGKPHAVRENETYDNQFQAIGWVEGTLYTLIFEIFEEDEGGLLWLINFWPSTKSEREYYEQTI